MTPSRRTLGTVAASLALAALPAAAIAVPTTQAGARDAMVVPTDVRAAGLPSSLVEIFQPQYNEKIWLCDGKGSSAVEATAPPLTYEANTEQFAKNVFTEVTQDISVFGSTADASTAFASVVSKAASCKGKVTAKEPGDKASKSINRSNGTASFTFGGQPAVWITQITPGPDGMKQLNEAEYQVFLLNGAVIQAVQYEVTGSSATKVSSSTRTKVDQLAQALAQRWTTAP